VFRTIVVAVHNKQPDNIIQTVGKPVQTVSWSVKQIPVNKKKEETNTHLDIDIDTGRALPLRHKYS
jgi:hypothetical protein